MNVPNVEFPELLRRLKKQATPPYDWRKPRRSIEIRHISKVRVSTKKTAKGVLIYPELFDGSWHNFWVDGEPLVNLSRYVKIAGHEVGDSARRKMEHIEKDWATWLKKWIRTNQYRIKFESKQTTETPKENERFIKPKKELAEKSDKEPKPDFKPLTDLPVFETS